MKVQLIKVIIILLSQIEKIKMLVGLCLMTLWLESLIQLISQKKHLVEMIIASQATSSRCNLKMMVKWIKPCSKLWNNLKQKLRMLMCLSMIEKNSMIWSRQMILWMIQKQSISAQKKLLNNMLTAKLTYLLHHHTNQSTTSH